jgi:hypothetical protein
MLTLHSSQRPLRVAVRRFVRHAALLLALVVLFGPAVVRARQVPEDLLKGRVILSDKNIPTNWNSVGSYVAQLKAMSKSVFWYDKKTGKVTVQYAAFFAQPIKDVQVDLVIYDVTNGGHSQKISNETFMNRGDRVQFNAVTFDKQDLEGNRKYLFSVEYRHRTVASAPFTLRMESEHYSGKVSFSDEETKEK